MTMHTISKNNSGDRSEKRGNISVSKIWEDPQYGLEDLSAEADANDLESEDALDDRFDCPNDAEDFDEDGTPLGEGADDEEENQFIDYTAVGVQSNGPALNFSKIHEIRVILRDGRYLCEYRPMPWQETGDRFPVAKRNAFLRTCARWLETQKQEFLATRQLEDYCKDDIEATPIVEQKGFLARINPMLDTPMKDEEELRHFRPSMGRILPFIYLVWEDGISLPLSALFGKEAKECWEQTNKKRYKSKIAGTE